MNRFAFFHLIVAPLAGAIAAGAQDYTTCKTWDELVAGKNIRYAQVTRVSDPGPRDRPAYTGFWFYDVQQFDTSGRHLLGMKVKFEGRAVAPEDRGEIGTIDLHDGNKWTKIGETTAWNWQQGCRLQWRPGSEEIIWNDRTEDGASFVCRTYDFKTGARRTLPRPIYDLSHDGKSALTHDFQRMKHGGTGYAPMPDRFAGQRAPAESGIELMDMNTGEVRFLLSLKRMAEIAHPQGYQGGTDLYFFREGWNPSATRFIAFLKDGGKPVTTKAWSISADGRDVRFFYDGPSHHTWQDDNTLLEGSGLKLYRDDGTGRVVRRLVEIETGAPFRLMPPTRVSDARCTLSRSVTFWTILRRRHRVPRNAEPGPNRSLLSHDALRQGRHPRRARPPQRDGRPGRLEPRRGFLPSAIRSKFSLRDNLTPIHSNS